MPITTPNDMTNIRLWLESTAAVALGGGTDGTKVLTWSDTTRGIVFTREPVFNIAPFYFGSPRVCLGFSPNSGNGIGRLERTSGGVNVDPSNVGIFAFADIASGSFQVSAETGTIFALGSDRLSLVISTSGRIGCRTSTGTLILSNLRCGASPTFIGVRASGSLLTFYRNEQTEVLVAPVSNTSSPLGTIGQRNSSFVESFWGRLYGLVVVENNTDETQFAELRDYWRTKHGLVTPTILVVCEGSSTMANTESTGRLLGYVARVEKNYPNVMFQVYAIGGATTNDMISDVATQIGPALQDDSFDHYVLVGQPGSNDLYTSGDSASTALTEAETFFNAAKSVRAGLKTAVMTMTPRNGAFSADAQRLVFNQGLRDGVALGKWDDVIDIAALPGLSTEGDQTNSYYYIDGVHLDDDGFAYGQTRFDASIASFISSFGGTPISYSMVVENGTGLPNADSLVTLEETNAYFSNLGIAEWTGTDVQKTNALKRGMQFIASRYRWIGRRSYQFQALPWPRSWIQDEDGYAIGSNETPRAIKEAQMEAALRYLQGIDLLADIANYDAVKSESIKVGPISLSTEYAGGADPRPYMEKIESLVAPYLLVGAGQSTVERG